MSKLLKNEINDEKVARLSKGLKCRQKRFDEVAFKQTIFQHDWADIELKARIRRVAQAVHQHLEGSYLQQLAILKPVSMEFDGLFHLVFSDFVEQYGLDEFDASMHALAMFTQRSTAEYAIRVFLQQEPRKTMSFLQTWSQSDNEHWRRLSSEALRPRLPWATQLSWLAKNPDWLRPVIEALNTDGSRYVQKSVANLLNDLTKTDPEWVLALLNEWDLTHPSTGWIAKHALRTLLKQGDQAAFQLLGYPDTTHIELMDWQQDPAVNRGARLQFGFTLKSQVPLGRIRLEYALFFVRKKQQPYRKTFKIAESEVMATSKRFQGCHDFKPISTRQYYPGFHRFELILNGRVIKTTGFILN